MEEKLEQTWQACLQANQRLDATEPEGKCWHDQKKHTLKAKGVRVSVYYGSLVHAHKPK